MRNLILFLLLVPCLAVAQTNVSGIQSGTWTQNNSPYLVTGHVTVPSGQTLNIEPGVEVNFQGYYKFNVSGNLQAIGSESSMILFTTDNPSTGWGGIRIDTNDMITMTYCRIEHGFATGSYPDMHGGGMAILGSSVVMNNCVFADNEADTNGMGGAIYAMGTYNSSFTDCTFIRNECYGEGGAIKFSADDYTEFTNCEFLQNHCNYGGGAVSGYGIYGTKFTGCLFVDNYTMYAGGGAVHTL
ncbi:right-handed parallel beta-helix repeat-containing protein, partial [bacterium]|nr:right-handed parallel beta-helix repeat-containing protein [bacterium]